jgi:hypothetical protein
MDTVPSIPAAAVDVPAVQHADAPVAGEDIPVVALVGTTVQLDNIPTGDVFAVLGSQKNIVEPLFHALLRRRLSWKDDHPNESFPGVVTLRLPDAASEAAVMGIFVAAAFAGYPNEAFEVKRASGGIGRMTLRAVIPVSEGGAGEPPRCVYVRVSREKVVLEPHQASKAVAQNEIEPSRLEEALLRFVPDEAGRTPAVLLFSVDYHLGEMLAVADRIASVTWEGHPRFDLALGVEPERASVVEHPGALTLSGRFLP